MAASDAAPAPTEVASATITNTDSALEKPSEATKAEKASQPADTPQEAKAADAEADTAKAANGAEAATTATNEAPSKEEKIEKVVYLAGRKFTTKAELCEHVKKIQDSVSDDEGRLSTESCLFLFHLCLHHPKAVEKMQSPVSHFRYGLYDLFKNKCFIMVRCDGSQEGVSAMKSIQQVYETTLVVGGSAASQEARGVKRDRESADMDQAAPPVFQPVPMVPGSVVDIHGCPSDIGYQELKEMLNEFGRVRYLKVNLGDGSKRTRRGNPECEKGNFGAATAGDAAEGSAGVASKETPEDGAVAEGSKGDKPVESKGVEGDKPADASEPAAASEAASVGEADAAMDGDDAPADAPVVARVRFDEAEGAKKALESLKEIEGRKVEIVVLTGADEQSFWDETNAKMKEIFDNPKGKGKDKGKGKGKDKGKGKGKGKGKDKGKKKW